MTTISVAQAKQATAQEQHPPGEGDCWIELTTGKAFSRLLYTNPVCFLFVHGDADPQKQTTRSHESSPTTITRGDNVQVLSWLTATDNEGGFVFSINQRRHTASFFLPLLKSRQTDESSNATTARPRQFTLSVPVHGMEELVLNVGSCSGRFGSKFQEDYSNHEATTQNATIAELVDNPSETTDESAPRMSKRQRRKLEKSQPRFPTGVPGLKRVPFGHQNNDSNRNEPQDKDVASGAAEPMESSTTATQDSDKDESDAHNHWCVGGTVAHLLCTVNQCVELPSSPSASDHRNTKDTHLLVMAQVNTAYVHPNYWDGQKNLFRPQPLQAPNSKSVPPYLTFFGSQTFGYVNTAPFGK